MDVTASIIKVPHDYKGYMFKFDCDCRSEFSLSVSDIWKIPPITPPMEIYARDMPCMVRCRNCGREYRVERDTPPIVTRSVRGKMPDVCPERGKSKWACRHCQYINECWGKNDENTVPIYCI